MVRFALLLGLLFACCKPDTGSVAGNRTADPEVAVYLGVAVCAECHPEQTAAWRSSHHDLAMQSATPDTVLGDFDDASFTYGKVTSRFSRRDARFFVSTDGRDGQYAEYEISYTFGVEPLQQYLVEFPGGRFQALSLVWDSRPAEVGGQRWFHLYPDEVVDHQDPLHWTGVYQNWNQQCAECHSTNLDKGYDPVADEYRTTYSEIDVACEACHGPGSIHVEWGRANPDARGSAIEVGLAVDLADRNGGGWVMNQATGIAERTGDRSSRQQVETCGRCHSRRSPITADYEHGRPLLDTHRVVLLEEGLYHADGHILDEVYVYGSFVQSKMYRSGVTCGDCHDPHSLTISTPDAICATCHLTAKFADSSHHFHQPESAGASCVECHMPSRDYMVVDGRRDHGFRIPRPDLSRSLGTPDACTDCHDDLELDRLVSSFEAWYPGIAERRPGFAAAIEAGRRSVPGAGGSLATLANDSEQPGIARGTALALMGRLPWALDSNTLSMGAASSDPFLRFGAARGSQNLPPQQRIEVLGPLLDDPVRAVRLEAADVLASGPSELIGGQLRASFEESLGELFSAQLVNGDRPDAQVRIGLIELARGSVDAAESAYQRALEIDPSFVPAYINYVDLLRASARDSEGEQLLERGIERMPDEPSLHHSLGLLLIRRQQLEAAIPTLELAARLAPHVPRYAYVHAIALHSSGSSERALEILEATHDLHPGYPEALQALASINRELGRIDASQGFASKLAELQSR